MICADWCVFAAALLPFPFTAAAKTSRKFDNATPREYLSALGGWRQRAHWVQLNSFEAFPPFAAAVIIAQLRNPPALGTLNALALGFIAFRLLYGACYLANQATLRTLMWCGGLACVVGLFLTAA